MGAARRPFFSSAIPRRCAREIGFAATSRRARQRLPFSRALRQQARVGSRRSGKAVTSRRSCRRQADIGEAAIVQIARGRPSMRRCSATRTGHKTRAADRTRRGGASMGVSSLSSRRMPARRRLTTGTVLRQSPKTVSVQSEDSYDGQRASGRKPRRHGARDAARPHRLARACRAARACPRCAGSPRSCGVSKSTVVEAYDRWRPKARSRRGAAPASTSPPPPEPLKLAAAPPLDPAVDLLTWCAARCEDHPQALHPASGWLPETWLPAEGIEKAVRAVARGPAPDEAALRRAARIRAAAPTDRRAARRARRADRPRQLAADGFGDAGARSRAAVLPVAGRPRRHRRSPLLQSGAAASAPIAPRSSPCPTIATAPTLRRWRRSSPRGGRASI